MTSAPLSERLRPTALRDLTLPLPIIERLERMLAARSVTNMLFHGETGTGKTSAARIIGATLHRQNFVEFDGTDLTTEAARRTIIGFSSSMPFGGQHEIKLCFIDAADFLPNRAQVALHKIIEDHHGTRFILAVNDRDALIKPIRSRLLPICFDIDTPNMRPVLDRLIPRYERVLTDAGIAFDESGLRRIVFGNLPDFRQIALHLDAAFPTT
jgi:DNA polymerase III delta prime subunit